MRHLIGLHAAQMLIRGARVINLVKIRAVAPVRRVRNETLLVQQRGGGGNIDLRSVRAVNGHLAQFGAAVRSDADIPRREVCVVVKFGVLPLEQVGILLRHGSHVGIGLAVGREGDGVIPRAEPGIVEDRADGFGLRQRERCAPAAFKDAERLRRRGAAEVAERGHGVHRRDHENGQNTVPLHALRRRKQRLAAQPQKQQDHKADRGCRKRIADDRHDALLLSFGRGLQSRRYRVRYFVIIVHPTPPCLPRWRKVACKIRCSYLT